jgi:16S rRNA (adenine1518-N6/adenine1519-N6)-dimethyltransferase
VQHGVAARIVDTAEIRSGDSVVEIGPGLGILTELILKASPRRLTLVEVDRRLVARLAARFGDDPRVTVINRDFLAEPDSEFAGQPVKVIGNLPFNVAAAILRRLSGYHDSVARMVLMFQREVAERIRALPDSDNYGALSVFTSLYWQITGHFRVAAGSFHPRPKVDAEVLVMEPRQDCIFDPAEEPEINRTIRAAFSAPRKTIRNSLAGGLGLDVNIIQAALEQVKIEPSARPATLDRAHLIALARILRPAASETSRA